MSPAAAAEPSKTTLYSAIFMPPGRPRPLARRLAIHNRVVGSVRAFFAERLFHEVPVTAMADHPARIQLQGMLQSGFKTVWCESEIIPARGRREPRHLRGYKLIEAASRKVDFEGLTDLQEDLLKFVARRMGADLLGGRDVTRLDAMLDVGHPRIRYRQALEILGKRGWTMAFGTPLHAEAEATLTRFCGGLPYMITHLPESLGKPGAGRDPRDPEVTESVEYVLPYAGITMEGIVTGGDDPLAGFSMGLHRLLQYLMGLGSVTDTLIDPMDRLARIMKAPPPGPGPSEGDGAAPEAS
jgi:aspartyl/asparaginyl-tRNA synthetase